MTGPDHIWFCPSSQSITCGINFNQTFTVNGYGVVIENQAGTLTGAKNVVTVSISNGTVSCPNIVITP